jgi:hypothetical protein
MITLTNEEFDEIVNEVIVQTLNGEDTSNIAVHANNRANGYDEDGNLKESKAV